MRGPSGDQSASSSIVAGLLVRFRGVARCSSRPSMSATKMSLSDAGAPGSTRVGAAAPDADAWKAILFPSGDQDAELPHVNDACADPSMFIRNRCVVLAGWPAVRSRL